MTLKKEYYKVKSYKQLISFNLIVFNKFNKYQYTNQLNDYQLRISMPTEERGQKYREKKRIVAAKGCNTLASIYAPVK